MTNSDSSSSNSYSQSANPLLGIGLLVLAEFFFASMDSIGKLLGTQEVPVPVVVWGRYAFHLGFMTMFFIGPRFKTLFQINRWGLVLLRGCQLLAATTVFFTAIRYIPLAEAVAIGFAAPLFTVALSVPLLKEQVGIRRWSAVIIGFIGVMVIVRPGFGEFHFAHGLMILLAFIFATFTINTRVLTRTEGTMPMLFFTALLGTAGASCVVPFFWQTPTLEQWFWLAAMGAIGGFSHMLLIQAYRVASTSLLAPFQYAQIIFAGFYGWLIFQEIPDNYVIVGAGIVVASGLYIIKREAELNRQNRPVQPASDASPQP